jgi:protein-S-isoprenylcysteine O-methyltransferase Ste14
MSGNAAEGPTSPDHADVVALPPILYGVALLVGVVTQWSLGGALVPESTLRVVAGAVAVLLGALGSRSFVRAFAETGQDRNPRTPTPSLVTDGLFAYSRNPAYVSLTLLYVGIALLLDNVWMVLFLVPVLVLMHYGVILREERYLTEKFGDEYRAYTQRVRRWL